MKNFIYLLRSYKYDLLTALFAVILYFVAFQYASDQKTILLLSLLITLVSVSLIIYLRLRDKDFYYVALTKRQQKDDWIGKGTFEFSRTNNAYIITDSEPGFIFSKCLSWSDYRFEFEFKIILACMGAVVRAVNLSDYVMFQIREDGIRPHIRINGGWKAWEAEEVNLKFEKKLSLDKWYKCTITCEKGSTNIIINDDKSVVLNRNWEIFDGRLDFPFPQAGEDKNPLKIHFPVNLDYGTIGFRNSGAEKGLVKNVLVEKL